MSWLMERLTPEYQETLRIAKQGLAQHSVFGRFAGRLHTTYTWNELVLKNWFDRHGIKYTHNYVIKGDAPEGHTRRYVPYELDFYLPAFGAGVELDPLFHYQTGHPVTQRVFLNDRAKDRFTREHGIHLIRVVAYPKPEDFAAEITEKLGPLARGY